MPTLNRNMHAKHAIAGVTLIELVISIVIFAVVMVVLNTVFISSNRVYGQTTVRSRQQMSERMGMSVMTTELRQAGCDPGNRGIESVPAATATSARVQMDYSGNGTIETAEPSETVTYTYTANAQTLSRDPGSGARVIMRNVSDCTFRYYTSDNVELTPPLSAAQRATIKTIGINLTTHTLRGGAVTADTRVTIRNE